MEDLREETVVHREEVAVDVEVEEDLEEGKDSELAG